jgi:hypothetical protein
MTALCPRFLLALCLGAAALLGGCHSFPRDFASRSLDSKIATYERWIAEVGRPRIEARAWIAWHGVPAANAMAPYLLGRKAGIPRSEALDILWAVQENGCSLRGTEAEDALRAYIRSEPASSGIAEIVLEDIRLDRHAVAGSDGLPPGPCSVSR